MGNILPGPHPTSRTWIGARSVTVENVCAVQCGVPEQPEPGMVAPADGGAPTPDEPVPAEASAFRLGATRYRQGESILCALRRHGELHQQRLLTPFPVEAFAPGYRAPQVVDPIAGGPMKSRAPAFVRCASPVMTVRRRRRSGSDAAARSPAVQAGSPPAGPAAQAPLCNRPPAPRHRLGVVRRRWRPASPLPADGWGPARRNTKTWGRGRR